MSAMHFPATLRSGARPTPQQRRATQHFTQGLALMEKKHWNDAVRAFEKAVKAWPADAVSWVNLAQAQRRAGRLAPAVDAARRAHRIDPTLTVAVQMEAICLSEQNRPDEAIAVLGDLVLTQDDDPELHYLRGRMLIQALRMREATTALMNALARKPDHVNAHVELGNAFSMLGMHEQAMLCFGTAAAIAGDTLSYVVAEMFQAMHACRWDVLPALRARFDNCLARPADGTIIPFQMVALSDDRRVQHQVATSFVRRQYGAIKPLPPRALQRDDGRRLRLAYLSSDLHGHATAYLAAELFERHDRERFELSLYSYGIDDGSPMRQRLKQAADHFIDVAQQSDREIAERIHADQIDILVDLKGYTLQTRTAILAYRPAPVQVNYLGYPGTLGDGLADYLIGDLVVTPLEHAADYGEKLALMPHSYQPNDRQRAIGARPSRADCGLPGQGVVFCCFNNVYKITPEIFSIWCRLLVAVPDSVLWLLSYSPQVRTNLQREAQARGVDPARLVFADKQPLAQHLGRLQNADLVLDTLPYNAHTTASDALWVGVPVVTCPGQTFASRVAASLCVAAGIPETVTDSLADYEALALALARDNKRRAQMRERLLAQRAQAPLFDTDSYVAAIEALYEQMTQRAIQGLCPEAMNAPAPH